MIARKRPKTPLEHIARAQELIEVVETKRGGEGVFHLNDAHLSLQLAHLHLRAAEVSAALPREVRSVADSVSAASLNQPVTVLGQAVGGVTPGQVAGIVQETIAAEKRRGTIR